MNRRAFLNALTAAAAGFVLDPERLLWTPGRKTIFVPPPTVEEGLSMKLLISQYDIALERVITSLDIAVGYGLLYGHDLTRQDATR